MSENLFAYTATNSGYSEGTAMVIRLSLIFLIETAAVWCCANIIILLPLSLTGSLIRRETGPCRYTARGGLVLPTCMA